MSCQGCGQTDVVYFTFFDLYDPYQFFSSNYCIVFRLKHILQKYKYYVMSMHDMYGSFDADSTTRLSPRLYKLVQSPTSLTDFENKIKTAKNLNKQLKKTLISKSK